PAGGKSASARRTRRRVGSQRPSSSGASALGGACCTFSNSLKARSQASRPLKRRNSVRASEISVFCAGRLKGRFGSLGLAALSAAGTATSSCASASRAGANASQAQAVKPSHTRSDSDVARPPSAGLSDVARPPSAGLGSCERLACLPAEGGRATFKIALPFRPWAIDVVFLAELVRRKTAQEILQKGAPRSRFLQPARAPAESFRVCCD